MPNNQVSEVRKPRYDSVTLVQKSAMISLWNKPLQTGHVHEATGDALVRKGYAKRLYRVLQPTYQLTQAGIRYNQTGKLIGE